MSSDLVHKPSALAAAVVDLVYPPRCPGCKGAVADDGKLCGPCRADTAFVWGAGCDLCGVPLPGDVDGPELCDDCLTIARPWDKGRAAIAYSGAGRRLILGFKHGDRTELAQLFAEWMAPVVREITDDDTLLVPIPINWSRLVRRRYNQSALLAKALSARTGQTCLADALVRHRRTPVLDGKRREERFALLSGAMQVRPKWSAQISGRKVLLIDDVMTTGATFAAAADALIGAGATRVCVAAMARVAKDT